MGCVEGVGYREFPAQSGLLGQKVQVCFNYEDRHLSGVIVRDDLEEPGRMIIRLEDGRYVLSTECQYTFTGDN